VTASIFISYSHKDTALVEPVVALLRASRSSFTLIRIRSGQGRSGAKNWVPRSLACFGIPEGSIVEYRAI
jgi:hypothetical protein